MIRTLWVGVMLLFSTFFFAGIAAGAGLLRVKGRVYDWTARTWSRVMLRASGTPVQVEGAEHISLERPQIIVCNHQSWYDVWAISAVLEQPFHFVAKKELERIPIFGRAWKSAGHVSIDRSDRQSAIRSLELAAERLRNEQAEVVIFPEGTRSPDGNLLPFKKGAFMLALKSGVEIVPAAVSGTRTVLPKGGWRVRPHPIKLRFGEPILVRRNDPAGAEPLLQLTRERVQALRDPSDVPSRPTTS